MDRRLLLVSLAGLVTLPRLLTAQERKTARVGFLLGGTASSPAIYIDRFTETLRESGWTEGKNLTLEYRYAEGHYERLPELARALVSRPVDVIVTEGTPPARAAKEATSTIPIVMATTADPAGTGLVEGLARPGGNITGVSWFFSEIVTKRLELLKEAAPNVVRVAVVYNALNPISEAALAAMESTGKTFKMRIQRLAVREPADFDTVLGALTRSTVDAVVVLEDPMTHSQSQRVVDAAIRGKVLAVFGLSTFVVAGGFMAYGPDRRALWRTAALLTDKILRGAKPADLPIEQPTQFELIINVKTAKALGLTVSPSLLLRADQVVQ